MSIARGGAGALPVIDLTRLVAGDPDGLVAVAREIGHACRTIGFFYIAGHGIAEALLADVFALSRTFFARPAAEKEALSISHSLNNRGYVGMDSENLDPDAPSDAKEAFNVGREPLPDEVTDPERPSQGTGLWPEIAGFRTVMTDYYQACQRLSETLHRAFAIDLGLPPDYFMPFVDRPSATLRLLHYPPRAGSAQDTRLGAGAHSDYGNVTLLAQDEVGGLEVRTRAGEWLPAPPIPGTFVCNIGDCLMRWSNDVYVSTPHRVVSSPDRERYSVAFFFDANADATIACLPTCLGPDGEARYEPVRFADYLRAKLDATYGFRQSVAPD